MSFKDHILILYPAFLLLHEISHGIFVVCAYIAVRTDKASITNIIVCTVPGCSGSMRAVVLTGGATSLRQLQSDL